MMLGAGLRAYLSTFSQHREVDGGATHPDSEWQQLKRDIGELIWRLEEAGVEPGTRIVHSAEAVEPEDPER